MASAVLVNRNEPNWPQHRGGGAGFMGKLPKSNSNPNPKFAMGTLSGDGSSINRRPNYVNHIPQYVTFNVASCTKNELKEIKNRLVSELEKVQRFQSRIQSREIQLRQSLNKKKTSKKVSGTKRSLPLNFPVKDLTRSNSEIVNMMKNCAQVLQKLMKHKHSWIFNVPVDVAGMGLHDYYDIIKKPMDLGTVKSNLAKNVYSMPSDFADDVRLTFNNAMTYNPKGHDVYAMAEQLLVRFEELYRPMHEKLQSCLRQDLDFDEELPATSWNHFEPESERVRRNENLNSMLPQTKLQHEPPIQLPAAPGSSLNPPIVHSLNPPIVHSPNPPIVHSPNPPIVHSPNPPIVQSPNPPIVQSPIIQSPNPPVVQSTVHTPSPLRAPLVKPVKQPKPRAKDPNKREMNIEEKHKLGLGLQSLPSEKMEQVVQIIRKRNGHLEQDGDEIELDIEAVDTETLWELDRLVTNYKKMVSKIKRQSLMTNVSNNNVDASNNHIGEVSGSEKVDRVGVEAKKTKKVEACGGDEDVDIGDEIPMSMFPPVEIERDRDVVGGGHASSSSSSSSSSSNDSSTSTDSDSGSSSGSGSEADTGHL